MDRPRKPRWSPDDLIPEVSEPWLSPEYQEHWSPPETWSSGGMFAEAGGFQNTSLPDVNYTSIPDVNYTSIPVNYTGEPGEVREIALHIEKIETYLKIYYYILTPIGIPLSSWLLTCLLMSRDLHSLMRPRLMISALWVTFLYQAVNQPIIIHLSTWFTRECDLLSFAFIFDSVLHATFNWVTTQLFTFHLCHVIGFDPSLRMTRRMTCALTFVYMYTPHVISMIVVPTLQHVTLRHSDRCTALISVRNVQYWSTMLPLLTSLVLSGLTGWLRWKRRAGVRADQRELVVDNQNIEVVESPNEEVPFEEVLEESPDEEELGQNLEVEVQSSENVSERERNACSVPWYPYVLMMAFMLLDLPFYGFVLGVHHGEKEFTKDWIIRHITMNYAKHLAALKHIVIPLTFLLFADIRENVCIASRRLWTLGKAVFCCWRSRGIELTVRYRAA